MKCRCDHVPGETWGEHEDRTWPLEQPTSFHGSILQLLSQRSCPDHELIEFELGPVAMLYLTADVYPDDNHRRLHE